MSLTCLYLSFLKWWLYEVSILNLDIFAHDFRWFQVFAGWIAAVCLYLPTCPAWSCMKSKAKGCSCVSRHIPAASLRGEKRSPSWQVRGGEPQLLSFCWLATKWGMSKLEEKMKDTHHSICMRMCAVYFNHLSWRPGFVPYFNQMLRQGRKASQKPRIQNDHLF